MKLKEIAGTCKNIFRKDEISKRKKYFGDPIT